MKTMKTKNLKPISIKERLAVLCSTRPKTFRAKDTSYDRLRKAINQCNRVLQDEHNCKTLFITTTFPPEVDLEDDWKQIGSFIEEFKRYVSKHYLIVGGVIAVEPHRNSSLTAPKGKGKNTKAGRPHLHMILWLTHEFLSPGLAYLDLALDDWGYNTRIKELKGHTDVIKSTLYSLKERENLSLRSVCQEYLGWSHNVNIWVNHSDCESLFVYLKERIKSCFLTKEMYVECPTTRKYSEDDLQIAELFAKLFMKGGLAVREQMVYRRAPGTKYTWNVYMPLNQWISDRFNFNLPVEYLRKLKHSANWILSGGSQTKQGPYFQLFPKLSLYMFYVEYTDCVYDFDRGDTTPFHQVPVNAATVCSTPHTWNETPPPWRILGLLYTLLARGVDSRQNYLDALKEIKDKGWVKNWNQGLIDNSEQHHLFVSAERGEKDFTSFFETLTYFGGLYHPKFARKQNPALYLEGRSNSFKTFLLEMIFKKLVGLENVDMLSRTKGRFNTSRLKKEDGQPYILFLDELRWDQLGMPFADFLALLDGKFVHTEKKWEKEQSGQLSGTIAITSNMGVGKTGKEQGPGGDFLAFEDRIALEARIRRVELHPLLEPSYDDISPDFWRGLEDEALGFSILTNASFLHKDPHYLHKIVLPKSFFSAPLAGQTASLERTGFSLMQSLLKRFQEKKSTGILQAH